MKKLHFVTITGLNHYYGKKPFEVGKIIQLIKDIDNEYDEEAICAVLPHIGVIGYVANSVHTVYRGTISAGRLYDKIDDRVFAKVMFITNSSVIAVVIDMKDIRVKQDSEDDIEETDEE